MLCVRLFVLAFEFVKYVCMGKRAGVEERGGGKKVIFIRTVSIHSIVKLIQWNPNVD